MDERIAESASHDFDSLSGAIALTHPELGRARGSVLTVLDAASSGAYQPEPGDPRTITSVFGHHRAGRYTGIRTDRSIEAPGRLRRELIEVMQAAGLSHAGIAFLGGSQCSGSLDDLVFLITWDVCQAMANDPLEITSHDPEAGVNAVGVLVSALRTVFKAAGITPNPLAGLDLAGLVNRIGGPDVWAATAAYDRPLLITQTVIRQALDSRDGADIGQV